MMEARVSLSQTDGEACRPWNDKRQSRCCVAGQLAADLHIPSSYPLRKRDATVVRTFAVVMSETKMSEVTISSQEVIST